MKFNKNTMEKVRKIQMNKWTGSLSLMKLNADRIYIQKLYFKLFIHSFMGIKIQSNILRDPGIQEVQLWK